MDQVRDRNEPASGKARGHRPPVDSLGVDDEHAGRSSAVKNHYRLFTKRFDYGITMNISQNISGITFSSYVTLSFFTAN